VLPDFNVTLPPELPPAEASPLARIWELAPRFNLSEATNSMTPFSLRTELAWNSVLVHDLGVHGDGSSIGDQVPSLSTEPSGRFTFMLKPRPSGRSLTTTSWPAASPMVPRPAR
jgi:hypothetical protein